MKTIALIYLCIGFGWLLIDLIRGAFSENDPGGFITIPIAFLIYILIWPWLIYVMIYNWNYDRNQKNRK